MKQDTLLALKKRLDVQKTARSNIEGVLNLIENYVVPFRARFYSDTEGSMNWRRRSLYDSTAVDSNQNLASNLHSGLTNSAYRWFSFVFRNKKLTDRLALTWLEDCANITFLALQESNFDLEINETFLDLTSFGTSLLTEEIEEEVGKFKRLVFSSVPLSQGYYEFNYLGKVEYFHRELSWTAVKIHTKFPEALLPEKVQAAFDSGSDEEFMVIFAVYPREDQKDANIQSILAPTARPYGYIYYLYEDVQQLGEEGGYYDMPVFAPRWRKTAGSNFGHSPAMVVLSDILTLNQLVEMILKAGEKALDPAILTRRRGVFGDIDLTSGGVTVVADEKSVWPFESKARFDVSALTKEDLQKSIRKAFFEDQLQLKESPQMTATEVQTRFEMMARLIGPSLGRILNDLHAPIVIRTFNGLYRFGQFPEPPPSVVEAKAEIDIEFMGPMARAQKMDKVASVERWVANLAQMSEFLPDIMDNVDGDEAAAETGLLLGVPALVVRSKSAIKTIRDKRASAQQAAEKLALAKEGSETIKNLGGMGNGQGFREGGEALG